MPGWLTLVIDMEPAADRRDQLRRAMTASDRPINQTTLMANGDEVGSLLALSKDALPGAKEAVADLSGRARAVRVDADIVAREAGASRPVFVFLAASLQRLSLDHDDVTIAGAIRAYLGQYLPRLGRHFVAVSTLLDRIRYAGGLTVVDASSEDEARQLTADDPWQRIFPGRPFRTATPFFQRQLPPPGPGTQRSGGGSPWPFHWT